jgi:hypothetical protein
MDKRKRTKGQKDKRINNDKQKKTLHRKLKIGDKVRYSGRVSSYCSTGDKHRVTLTTKTSQDNDIMNK